MHQLQRAYTNIGKIALGAILMTTLISGLQNPPLGWSRLLSISYYPKPHLFCTGMFSPTCLSPSLLYLANANSDSLHEIARFYALKGSTAKELAFSVCLIKSKLMPVILETSWAFVGHSSSVLGLNSEVLCCVFVSEFFLIKSVAWNWVWVKNSSLIYRDVGALILCTQFPNPLLFSKIHIHNCVCTCVCVNMYVGVKKQNLNERKLNIALLYSSN